MYAVLVRRKVVSLDDAACDTCGHPIDAHDLRGWSDDSDCLSACERCLAALRQLEATERRLAFGGAGYAGRA